MVDCLPGYPDGVTTASDGNFWVVLPAARVKLLDFLLPWRFARWVAAWATELFGAPAWVPVGWVLKVCMCLLGHDCCRSSGIENTHFLLLPTTQVSGDGAILESLMDPDGRVLSGLSSVHEHNGALYFGSVVNNYVAVLNLT